MKNLVINSSNMTGAKAFAVCPVLSEPVGGKVFALLPDGSSCTVDIDTLRHEGPAGAYIAFTTQEAIALAEYERSRGH
jgi:hypothetical protein